MKNIGKLFNAVFLISGTAIGAGLIALPLVAVNLGMLFLIFIIVFSAFIAYQSSMMAIDLNKKNGKSASIVELSNNRVTRILSLLSFYILSFALLTVYVSAIADSLGAFFNINNDFLVILCGLFLFIVLNIRFSYFQRINSVLVTILLLIIIISIVNIYVESTGIDTRLLLSTSTVQLSEIVVFLPIIFTSFGVQNICPYVYDYLHGDKKMIKCAFIVGIIIPTIFYIVYIYSVFENVLTRDIVFFNKLQNHQVSVGELITFLCNSSSEIHMEILFKVLSVLAIVTSAIGIGLGLLKSVQEIMKGSKKLSSAIICVVPILFGIIVPNAFINVLSFGGMIATMFVIFIPYYLLTSQYVNTNSGKYNVCLLFGMIIILCELLHCIK